MPLVALKDKFRFGGKRIAIGTEFSASRTDAKLLIALGQARAVENNPGEPAVPHVPEEPVQAQKEQRKPVDPNPGEPDAPHVPTSAPPPDESQREHRDREPAENPGEPVTPHVPETEAGAVSAVTHEEMERPRPADIPSAAAAPARGRTPARNAEPQRPHRRGYSRRDMTPEE